MGWFEHLFGFWDGAGNSPQYLAWSGVLSDLGELAIIGSLLTLVRHRTCEVHHCWRLGRHTTAAGHKVCRRHHPDGHLTAGDVHASHHEAREGAG